MKKTTRQQAIDQGLTRYYTGIRCMYGHDSERYTSTANCIECKKNADKLYYQSIKDRYRKARERLK